MMRYTCTACRRGMHDQCDGRRPPPPRHLGGSECICDGKCGERTPESEQEEFVEEMLRLMQEAGTA